MCTIISHVHILAFTFLNSICINFIDMSSLLYSTVLLHYICYFVLCTRLIGGNKDIIIRHRYLYGNVGRGGVLYPLIPLF